MNKKKITYMLLILAMVTLFSFSANTECNAATNKKNTTISINKKNFPDKAFRKYVKKKFDKNKDGKLSKKEISKVKTLYIFESTLGIKKFEKFNCKGLQYFKNVKELHIDSESGMKEGISNVKYLLKMKKLKYLSISGTFEKKTLDIEPLKNLKTLIIADSNLKTIKLNKNKKLKKVKICFNYYIKKLDLGKNVKLKYIDCYYNRISEIKLPKKNVIKELNLSGNKLKAFDTGILNPKTFEKLEIDGTLVKKIDVMHLTNLEEITTNEETEVIKGDNQKFEHFIEEWDYYGYLKEIW